MLTEGGVYIYRPILSFLYIKNFKMKDGKN
jgi:hypothetical protein